MDTTDHTASSTLAAAGFFAARSGATLIEGTLARIRPSPTNPRKTFRHLEELAGSIERDGVRIPILVRPVPLDDAGCDLELVYGERRVRASRLAGRTTIPMLVQHLTDDQVLDEQLTENAGRDDLQPLEEGELYEDQVINRGRTVKELAAKVGKSAAWVADRRALCRLAKGPRDALAEDKITVSVAGLIALIPDTKLQHEALALVQAGRIVAGLEALSTGSVIEPLTFREAKLLIRARFHLRLDSAPFDRTDPMLVEAAGTCTKCPHRTGNQRELFADVKSGDICTNPPCFDSKKRAAWDLKAAEATRSGLRVLTDKEQRRVFAPGATVPAFDSPFVDLSSPLPMDLADASGKSTWMQLAGKKPPDPVVTQDGSGAPRDLVDRAAVIARAKESGLLKDGPAPVRQTKASGMTTAEAKAQRERDAMKAEVRRRVIRAQLGAIATAAIPEPKTTAAELGLWRWIVEALSEVTPTSDLEHVVTRRELKLGKAANAEAVAIRGAAESCKTPGAVRALAVEILAATGAPSSFNLGRRHFQDGADLLGVGLKAVEAEVVAAAKAEVKAKEEAAAPKKPAAKVKRDPAAICGAVDGSGPGCIHAAGHADAHSSGIRTWKNKAPKPGKLLDGHGVEIDWNSGKPVEPKKPATGKTGKGGKS